jgi:UDP-N-acetylmuramate dehydrogenase
MLNIQNNVSLLSYNTFHVDARARFFVTIRSLDELEWLWNEPIFKENKKLFLGGGSNILFTRDFDGLVIQNELKGIETVRETGNHTTVRVGSGENWHQFVMYCVEHDLGGIENLSLIPGTVGAAPMQNIGAYGVEVKDVIDEVTAVDLSSFAIRTFNRNECEFGYRESFFKHQGKNRYFISSVTLTLTKTNHRFNTSYGAITETLRSMGVNDLSVRAISDAVIRIRRSKLPDPAIVGNAGSFFKNPTVNHEKYEELKTNFPSIPGFPEENNRIKVPAGWLIEQCGWKGKTFDSIGVHPLQALVLVNYGSGTGEEIKKLSEEIQATVKEKFDISLHAEVNFIE